MTTKHNFLRRYITSNRTPQFEHRCDRCIFLGRAAYDNLPGSKVSEAHDLYYCPIGKEPSVIARYGNEPDQYLLGIPGRTVVSGVNGPPPLGEAANTVLLRAVICAVEHGLDMFKGED